jgi:hypothetical protein
MSNHPYEERTIGIKDKDHDGDDHQNEISVVKKPKPNNGHDVTRWSQGSSFLLSVVVVVVVVVTRGMCVVDLPVAYC